MCRTRLGYDEISEILKVIDSSSCEEFVFEGDGIKLVVRRKAANGAANGAASSLDAVSPAETKPAHPSAIARASEPAVANIAPAQDHGAGHAVRAPMVGTFYSAPSPGEPPFVVVGAQVKKGDPLCIIEVMKLFTTVFAESDGIVEQVCAQNATAVEYGQTLFLMRSV